MDYINYKQLIFKLMLIAIWKLVMKDKYVTFLLLKYYFRNIRGS